MKMTTSASRRGQAGLCLPDWVPEGALNYLSHTETGVSIRALARGAGCHASTVLRQVRRVETRRDDPLVDGALRRLATEQGKLPDADTLHREALRILRRLCESGAVLAVATGMENAVVVRDTAGGGSTRTAVVSVDVARFMALLDWIAPKGTGRILRYQITATGRTRLEELLESGIRSGPDAGFAEDAAPFDGPGSLPVDPGGADTPARRTRYALAESPLIALSRRRDHAGNPFLSTVMVTAGERLREDFELGQMGLGDAPGADTVAARARARVAAALGDLGPGLSDVAMRCCCYLEGLETTEKRLGWSARSGKIVLRIALMRLAKHYENTLGPSAPMIG